MGLINYRQNKKVPFISIGIFAALFGALLIFSSVAATYPDFNDDGKVDMADLSTMLSNYGKSGVGDLDNSGLVDIFDLSILLSNYGKNVAPSNSPSGVPMPTEQTITSGGFNWQQVFTDDFSTNIALGSFPTAVANKWSAYPDGTRDTFCNGVFYPSKVNSVSNGVLNNYLHDETVTYTIWPGQEKSACPTAGTFTKQIRLGSALVPKIGGGSGDQLYGRYAVRFKTDALPNYYAAWLLWPQSEVWPRDGEIDWPEGALNGTMSGFVHWMNGTSGSDQQGCSSTTKFLDDSAVNKWNTVVTEWAPGSVKFYANDQLVCTVTGSRVPSTPMHYVLQTETGDTSTNNWVDGNLQVDWIAIYKKL